MCVSDQETQTPECQGMPYRPLRIVAVCDTIERRGRGFLAVDIEKACQYHEFGQEYRPRPSYTACAWSAFQQ